MTSAQVLDSKGNKVRQIDLDDSVFGIEPNTPLLHAALVRQLANARRGTASTKTRSEVSGGGKKPWRQKGTGNARAGSIRSPLWEGGGVIFGPKPRSYAQSMPRKARLIAIKSALAARRESLVVVQNFDDVKEGKTKEFSTLLGGLGLSGKKVLLVLENNSDHSRKVERAARNIDRLTVIHTSNLNVKDLLNADVLLTAEPVLTQITQRFKSESAKVQAEPVKEKEVKAKAKTKETEKETEKKASPSAAKKPAKQ